MATSNTQGSTAPWDVDCPKRLAERQQNPAVTTQHTLPQLEFAKLLKIHTIQFGLHYVSVLRENTVRVADLSVRPMCCAAKVLQLLMNLLALLSVRLSVCRAPHTSCTAAIPGIFSLSF